MMGGKEGLREMNWKKRDVIEEFPLNWMEREVEVT